MYQLCTGLAHCHGHGVMHRLEKSSFCLSSKSSFLHIFYLGTVFIHVVGRVTDMNMNL
jgi:cyclin-dependent kinase